MEWRIILEGPGFVVAHVDGLLLQIWDGPAPTADGFDLLVPVLEGDFQRTGRKPAALTIVGVSSELPDEAARKKGATLPGWISHYVGVHEGGSLRASVVRMVIASITMLSAHRAEATIVSTVEEGVEQLTARCPSLPPGHELLAAIVALRQRVVPARRR
jgi:hypothetical protein